MHELRYDVRTAERLHALAHAPLPPALRATPPVRQLHRDLWLDTADDALRRRGVRCRLRLADDGRHALTLVIGAAPGEASDPGEPRRVRSRVRATEAREALAEETAVTRRLRAIVDPDALEVRVATEVERWARDADPDWFGRARLALHYDRVTVRRDGEARDFHRLCIHRRRGRGTALDLLARALADEPGLTPTTSDARERAELVLKWMPRTAWAPTPTTPLRATTTASAAVAAPGAPAAAALLDPELSVLAFQERVLAMAEDDCTPLGERLEFLAIVSGNLDEFFSVRVAGLAAAALEPSEEPAEDPTGTPRSPEDRLVAIAERAERLVARMYACWRVCAAALDAAAGVRIVRWGMLDADQRAELRERFRDDVLPGLTPLAMTLSPGHPFPRPPHLSLSLAVVLRDREGTPPHFAEVELPPSLPRVLEVPAADGGRCIVPLEEVVRANLDLVHPNARIEEAYAFRVTRGGGLPLDERAADDLLRAVDEAARRRPENAAVRLEVERAMPVLLRELVLAALRREGSTDGAGGARTPELRTRDVYEIPGPLDLRWLASIELPRDVGFEWPPFRARRPVSAGRSMLDAIADRDLLVHHPFESYEDTVLRFLEEAARDERTTAIKIILYRMGERSPVLAALVEAAQRGKTVMAFVELKARFDEARNVGGARALEAAGGRVVYGLVGLKTHAKAALVVRREGDRLRRYAHVGTGNYSVHAGRHYTDLSLFTTRESTTADVAALFNALTGGSSAPRALEHGALVSPHQLLPAILERIERETAHARAGRGAAIRIKVNGLSDGPVVRALYAAAQAGVRIDLAVRGICTLRPGVPGLSEGIRVVSIVGRFLEHSRIYHFANGDEPEWFIGSADLRPRNLRRRVELLVPVVDPAACARLDALLGAYLDDPTAWALAPSGEYVARGGTGGVQETELVLD